jgi:hypothetical protein
MPTNIIDGSHGDAAADERARFAEMNASPGMRPPCLHQDATSDFSINKPLSLTRNFSWTLVGTGLYAVCQWGMLVVLAKLCSTTMVGQFALAMAITAPMVVTAGGVAIPCRA